MLGNTINNFRIKLVMLLLLVVGTTGNLKAEEDKDIMIAAYNTRNYVLLRWYPQSIEVYRKCQEKGFLIERRLIGDAAGWEQLEVVKPASYEEFVAASKKDSKVLIMNFILHKKEMLAHASDFDYLSDSTETNPIDMAQYDKPTEQAMLYALGLISCEFSADRAKLAGLNYLDERVRTQQRYEYRVVPAGNVKGISSASVIVNTGTETKLSAPHPLKFDMHREEVRFNWSTVNMEKDYSGYQLERSADGKNFTVVNDEPIIHIMTDEKTKDKCLYSDTLPKCDKDYWYRYCGLSRFGIKGPYSQPVMVRFECDYSVFVDLKRVERAKDGLHLSWEVDNPLKQQIKGFYVERVEHYKPTADNSVAFTRINKGKMLPPTARSFVDTKPLATNYYRVTAVGPKNGQEANSFPQFMNVADTIPPVPPTGLKGSIDSAGVVTLTWAPNTDPDIMAYRVFFANTVDGFYVNASDTFLTTPYFTDTLFLGSLTNDIYYKVLAIDQNYNQSDLSEPLKLMKPDTIAPYKAVFDRIYQQKESPSIEISWTNSPSTDVVRLELLRREGDNGEFRLLKSWENTQFPEQFTDTTEASDVNVYYNLVCYDYSGNKTLTEGVPVYAREKKRVCVKDINLVPDYERGGIRVEWSKCGCKIDMFRIFREDDGEQMLLVTVGGMETGYFDQKVKKGHTYKYIIKPEAKYFTKIAVSEEINF